MSKKLRETGIAMMILAVMMLTAACGGSQGSSSSSSSNGQVAAIIKGLDNPFFQAMQQGIQDQAKAQSTNVTVQAATSITDTTGQADKLQAVAGQNYGCYIVNPISGTNLVQPLVPISQANKPIINIDNPISTEKGFFVANDDMALGVGRAIADAGKQGQVQVVSVDGIQDALKAVQAGTLSATVSQYPYTIGAMGVEACKAAMAGKTLPAKVTAPVLLVTKDNAAQALSSFPKPFTSYSDPFTTLNGK